MKVDSSVWSAIAASFAALSAFLTMRIHRRNLFESMRPELVLEDWSRREEHGADIVSFKHVRNVGRGPAFRVMLNSFRETDNRPQAILSSTWLPLIASGESVEVDGDILIWWDNVAAADDDIKHLPIEVEVTCSDRREWRHKVEYVLLATPVSDRVGMANPLLPGVMMPERKTKSTPVWWLRTRARIAKVPLLGRVIKPW